MAAPIELARHRQLEFTADASHELRTPLSVIEANTSLALARDRDVEWYRAAFMRLDGETQRMRRLLEDMLWLARFDSLQGAPQSELVDLGVLAEKTGDRFRAVAELHGQTLALDMEPGPHVVSAPPEWLDRLVGVLLDNACKYTPDGGTVRLRLGRTAAGFGLTVDDSGPGIPRTERARVFDRFHRAADTESGRGLGLAIADSIVRATKGHWRIGSSAGGGSSMTVLWPRALASRRQAGRGGVAASAAVAPGAVASSAAVAPTESDSARADP